MKNNTISTVSKLLLILAALFLLIAVFVPIWKIELAAPQYPEGLSMYINSNSLSGDVNIINGLNHYIGMKTLHAEEFIEFKVLPYLIVFFAVLTFITVLFSQKRLLYFLVILFILFGVLAMLDFWRWEYHYGHDLDPTAAIIVPGMAYQPPLIGFKQLLNFGAYSIPAIGGWLFIVSGICMFVSALIEIGVFNKIKMFKAKATVSISALMLFLISCSSDLPVAIKLNQASCDYCKMRITNGRLGAELQTSKGRVYMFDDMGCMIKYMKENKNIEIKKCFVNDYEAENVLIVASDAFFVHSSIIASPMNGNLAAFKTTLAAEKYLQKNTGVIKKWEELIR